MNTTATHTQPAENWMEMQSNRNKKPIEIHTNIHFKGKKDGMEWKKNYDVINDSSAVWQMTFEML